MDAVYLTRHGDSNPELLYSIRSLRYLPVNHVWVAGYVPRWIKDAGTIRTNQTQTRYMNVFYQLDAIARNDDISEEFLLMNDDFFVMWRTFSDIPVYHRGLLDLFIEESHINAGYGRYLQRTADLLRSWGIDNPLAFTSHCPVVMKRECLAELCDALKPGSDRLPPGQTGQGGGYLYRTLYGNLFEGGGIRAPDFKVAGRSIEDFQKVVDRHHGNPLFLSTDDQAFMYGHVGAVIRAKHPKPSPYEDTELFLRITRITHRLGWNIR